MTVEGGTSGAVFLRFVREHLCTTLHGGCVVVMDNFGAHHATGVREANEAVGVSVVYMLPYSPDLNPIELCWSKLKSVLRTLGARIRTALLSGIEFAATSITRCDEWPWFRHCGYRRHQAS
jgi:transposase